MNVSMVAAQEENIEMMDRMHGCVQDMNMVDSNEDGEISNEGVMQAHERMFTRMDQNGDGKITRNEMVGMGNHRMMEKK